MAKTININHSQVYVNNHKHRGKGMVEINNNMIANQMFEEIIKSKDEEIKFLRETIDRLLDYSKSKSK